MEPVQPDGWADPPSSATVGCGRCDWEGDDRYADDHKCSGCGEECGSIECCVDETEVDEDRRDGGR